MSKKLGTVMELLEVLLALTKRVFDITTLFDEDGNDKSRYLNYSKKKLHR